MRQDRAAPEGLPPAAGAGRLTTAPAGEPLTQLQSALHTLHVAHERIALDPARAGACVRQAIATIEDAVPHLRAELLAGRAGHAGKLARGRRP